MEINETADNKVDLELTTTLDELTDSPPVKKEPELDQTKAYSERLKKDREKIKNETREEIAQSFGYSTWEEYKKAQTDNTLLDKGLDPETVRPVLKDLIRSDPDYIKAMEYKKEKEALESKIWAEGEVKRLNDMFGLTIDSVDSLDEETVKLWNTGIPLEKAYAANHYFDIQNAAIKKSKISTSGKDHLQTINTGNSVQTKQLSADEMRIFKALNPNASEDAIKAYINRK